MASTSGEQSGGGPFQSEWEVNMPKLLKIVSSCCNHLPPSWNQAAHGVLELDHRDGVQDCINLASQLMHVCEVASFQVFFHPAEQPVVGRSDIR